MISEPAWDQLNCYDDSLYPEREPRATCGPDGLCEFHITGGPSDDTCGPDESLSDSLNESIKETSK